jgi:cell division septation protein DedD
VEDVQRKIFLQKNGRSGGRQSYVKLILLAAVALILLVILTPLFTREKGEKSARKPLPERGMVMREIPQRAPEPQEESVDGGGQATRELPEPTRPEIASSPQPGETRPVEQQNGVPPGTDKLASNDPGEWKQPQRGSELRESPATPPAATDPFKPQEMMKKEMPSPPESTTLKPQPVATKPDSPAVSPPAKKQQLTSVKPPVGPASKSGIPESQPAPAQPPAGADLQKKQSSGGPGKYTVQVGSFKEKQNAEEMRQNLQKRGYSVYIKPTAHPTLGQLYVVQLEPVNDMGRASTQMEQIKHEEKVKPIILKVAQ